MNIRRLRDGGRIRGGFLARTDGPMWLRIMIVCTSLALGEPSAPKPLPFTERVPALVAEQAGDADLLQAWIAAGEPRAERRAFAGALASFGSLRPAALAAWAPEVFGADQATNALWLEALGDVGDSPVVPALLSSLGRDAALDKLVLEQLARCGPVLAPWAVEGIGGKLGGWLQHPEDGVAVAALNALVAFQAFDEVDRLLVALEDPRQAFAGAALAGLRHWTGHDLGAGPDAWKAWIAEEQAFADGPLPGQLEDLRFAPVSELAGRLRALEGHGLLRGQVASGVARLLERPEAGVRELACRFLGTSGSERAVGVLVQVLADESTGPAAKAALGQLTGREESDWSRWFEAWRTAP